MDRTLLTMYPLASRAHKLRIEEIAVRPGDRHDPPVGDLAERVARCAARVRAARHADRPVIVTFGAHLVKNGLAPVLRRLIADGWVTHVATNGAGSIHDWEFAYLGMSTEDVRANTAAGRFGTWDETGRYIGLALATGAAAGLGYGASVGRMISSSGLDLPTRSELLRRADAALADEGEGAADTAAAIADLIAVMAVAKTIPGRLTVRHPHEQYSIQAAAWQAGIPFTVHPGIGYDIIYTHPLVSGGAVGRCALRDFLTYAGSVLRLSGGVHLTVGSSVMGPMIFEKALSMANNHLCSGAGEPVHDHYLAVVDIQDGGDWDWRSGEPPMAHPAYYLRFCKTFVRMGGTLDYLCMDNRQFLLALCAELGSAPRSAIE